jgi:hypothetical protein
MSWKRTFLAACVAATSSAACGTQYSDPILAPPVDAGFDAGVCSGGRALQFDGSGFGTLTRMIQDDFTLEAWIKTSTSITGQGAYLGNPVIFADVPMITTDDFGAAILNDKFRMTIGNPDTPVESTTSVTTNRWIHVAASRNHATGIVLVYIDGTLEGSGTGNTRPLSASPTMSFGGRAKRDFFVGQMSEIRMWGVVRSQAEIVANMHRRLSGSEPGLVDYYRLDEISGTIAHDATATHNDATLEGQTTWVVADPPVCSPKPPAP